MKQKCLTMVKVMTALVLAVLMMVGSVSNVVGAVIDTAGFDGRAIVPSVLKGLEIGENVNVADTADEADAEENQIVRGNKDLADTGANVDLANTGWADYNYVNAKGSWADSGKGYFKYSSTYTALGLTTVSDNYFHYTFIFKCNDSDSNTNTYNYKFGPEVGNNTSGSSWGPLFGKGNYTFTSAANGPTGFWTNGAADFNLNVAATPSGYSYIRFSCKPSEGDAGALYVYQTAIADLSASYSASSVKAGTSLDITPTVSGGTGSYTYSYTLRETNASGAVLTNSDYISGNTFKAVKPGTYYLSTVVTDGTITDLTKTVTKTITVTDANWHLVQEGSSVSNANKFTSNGDGTFTYVGTLNNTTNYYLQNDAGQTYGPVSSGSFHITSSNINNWVSMSPSSGNAFYINTGTSGTYIVTLDTNNKQVKFQSTTPLAAPVISISSSIANAGDTVTLSWDAVTNATSYDVYKDDVLLTNVATTSYQITNNASNANEGVYTVKAKTTNISYTDSLASNAVTLTLQSPRFYLVGDVGSDSFSAVNSVSTASTYDPDSTATAQDSATYAQRWTTPYEVLMIDTPVSGEPGKYSLTVNTKDVEWAINVGLFESTDGTSGDQYGFKVGESYYNKPNADYTVPISGIVSGDECYAIKGSGSLILPKNTEVTIYVDQTDNNKVTIVTNRVQVKAVARVKNFVLDHNNTPTLGAAVNATAAIATAKVTYANDSNIKPATATLTATRVDTAYTFRGWYTNSACTTEATFTGHGLETANLTGINDSVTYYALYEETTARDYDYNITAGENGSFTSLVTANCVGHHSGTQSGKVYRNGTLVFTVTPNAGYEVAGVTTTSGAVDYQVTDSTNGQSTVTISNITADATINVTFQEASTYDLTFVLGETAAYGNNFSVNYIDQSGTNHTTAATVSNNQTIKAIVGTEVTIKANPQSGKAFNGWHLEGSYQRHSTTPLSGDTIKIKPGSNMTITALFAEKAAGTSSKYQVDFTNSNPDTIFSSFESVSLGDLSSWQNKTIYKATVTASVTDANTNFIIKDTTNSIEYKFESSAISVNNEYWPKDTTQNYSNATNYGVISLTSGTTYYFYVFENKYRDNDSSKAKELGLYISTTDLLSGGSSGAGDNDNIDKSTLTKLYVLDGVDTNGNFGTRTFGDTVVDSSTQGLAKNNFYDKTEDENLYKENTGDEGALLYYYDPHSNLDFRVRTTIAENHQAIGVRAYVMNGMTYEAKKDSDGTYYADITLEAEETAKGTSTETYDVLEIIPVYYNTLIPDRDYIKFYVDPNTITEPGWGKTIGYSLWYANSGNHGFEGGYPGQPLMSDGNLLYGYFPKYYVDVDAEHLPEAVDYNRFNGVLLSNLCEHNSTHLEVVNAWDGTSLTSANCNYQSFDYLDPVEISKIGDADMIEFIAKYNNSMDQAFRTTLNSRTLYNLNGGNAWPTASVAAPSSAADALANGFEYLLDIDGNRVNILNEHDTELTGNPIYVVSAGNQNSSSVAGLDSSNEWDTVWNLYDSTNGAPTGNSLIAVRPVDFINPSDDLKDRLTTAFGENYQNRPVIIHYEKWLAGENNSGTRLDGRWLYTRSSDSTNVRLRVATKSGDTLTFSDEFINWAEITDGHINGPKETLDAYTKKLDLDNRTTEVTAKINPVNYKVTGFYMLGAHYSSDDNNGFSTDIKDYNALKANGTAYSFTNTQNNRLVIVIEEVPATSLTVLHQIYGGPGAHNIDGVFKTKVELADKDGNVITLDADETQNEAIYGNFFSGLKEFTAFNTDAPYYVDDNTTPVKQLKITLRTEMYATTAFNQWYENGPSEEQRYVEIDSATAKGKETPVEKVIYIDINTLYEDIVDETTGAVTGHQLKTRSLNYFSDLISNATVDINHFLIGASAGMTANTYTHVTVVDSSGNPISGGDYDYRAQTTTVDTEHITKENAELGYQLYVEIWTEPTGYCGFDDFYLDADNAITTGVVGDIYYTNEETDTKTVAGKTYQIATATIPISYFFKQTVADGNTVTIFDTAKKQYTLYSKLTDLRGTLDITHSLTGTGNAKTYITVEQLSNTDVLINTPVQKTETNEANNYKVSVGEEYIRPDSTNKLRITLTCELGDWTDFVRFDNIVNNLVSELTDNNGCGVTASVSIDKADNVVKTATILFRISNLFNSDKTQKVNQLDFQSVIVKPTFKYEITYMYDPYVSSYNTQSYFKSGTFLEEELLDYMIYDNHKTLDFKSDTDEKSFVSSKAPYEDNFMQTLDYSKYETAVVSYDNLNRDHTLVITVMPKVTNAEINVNLKLPYEITNETNYTPKEDASNRVVEVATSINHSRRAPMYGWLVTSGKQGPNDTTEGEPNFISAPLLIYNTSSQTYKHFVYWRVTTAGTYNTTAKEYTRCYDYEFNLAIFQDCTVEPVYATGEFDAEKMPNPPTTWNMYDRFDPYVMRNGDTDDASGVTITFIENSRNQYNHNGCGNLDPQNGGVPTSRQGAADRIYSDFLLSYNNIVPGVERLQELNGQYKCGIIIETAGNVDTSKGVEEESVYVERFKDSLNEDNIINFIEAGPSKVNQSGMMKSEFDVSELDDKNRLKYYVGLNNRTPQSYGIGTNPELPNTYTSTHSRVLRAYSYIYKVGVNDAVTDVHISANPTYFSIYDIGSIQDGTTN